MWFPKNVFKTKDMFFHSRLSYYQRIADLVPDSFSNLVPLKPVTTFKYAQEGAGKKSSDKS